MTYARCNLFNFGVQAAMMKKAPGCSQNYSALGNRLVLGRSASSNIDFLKQDTFVERLGSCAQDMSTQRTIESVISRLKYGRV